MTNNDPRRVDHDDERTAAPSDTAQRGQMSAAILAQRERLAADCERRNPRAVIRCDGEGKACTLFTVYDHPKLGRVIVKDGIRRAQDHADNLATSRSAVVIAAPVEALIAAAGGQPIGSLVACAHLEANITPKALRWMARLESNYVLRQDELHRRAALPYSGIEMH